MAKTEKYYKWKKDYYLKRRENKSANMKRWSEQDITLLFEFKGTDSELSKVLNRSVQAIQVKRSKVIKIESQQSQPTGIVEDYEPIRFEFTTADRFRTETVMETVDTVTEHIDRAILTEAFRLADETDIIVEINRTEL